ncbi:MAG: diacylglycerol kinase family lipid kinase [Acidobacteria bacterium]|nr:diacylglycerol kinase family lipid kinase [Acidobacteriota bacterium]
MLFVINPTAARGRAKREWSKARLELCKRGVNFKEHLTSKPGEACEATRQALLAGEVCVIAVGGDGTLNEVVSGYFGEAGQPINPQAAIGLLPCGTGSDFRRSVGLMNRRMALHAILSGQSQLIDVVKVELFTPNGQPVFCYSVNVVSFGLGGEVVKLVNSWRNTWPRWVGGSARFVLAALKALKAYQNRPVKFVLDDSRLEIQTNFFVVANGRFAGGGMQFAPQAEFDDGLMDVVMANGVNRWEVVKELPRIRSGGHLRNPKIEFRRSRTVTVTTSQPLLVDVDGESAGITPARLTIQPAAIRFLTSATDKF